MAGFVTALHTLFDERANLEEIVAAADLAAIAEDIETMPMRYDTLVGDMGNSLSGGQRQRLLLARALYRKPRLLVVDEGTSHLDMEREKRVNASLSGLGITRIIVAHRRETIESADRIYVLAGGTLHPASVNDGRSTSESESAVKPQSAA